ncbi:MAG: nucleotide exchange factor GrpE [Candidatus Pacebacteria bacterium]|nr:nucleotide exchange factor GrpE [Candidatus Paceibacterota bacterium]
MEELKKCEKEKQEYLEAWKRAKADLINYKKEEVERIASISNYIQENFILEILLVLDNMEIAEKTVPPNNDWFQGLLNIKKQINSLLEKRGVKQINTKDQVFDPNFHEAIDIQDIPDKKSGLILEEAQKGYLFGDKVIRPAKVKVNK